LKNEVYLKNIRHTNHPPSPLKPTPITRTTLPTLIRLSINNRLERKPPINVVASWERVLRASDTVEHFWRHEVAEMERELAVRRIVDYWDAVAAARGFDDGVRRVRGANVEVNRFGVLGWMGAFVGIEDRRDVMHVFAGCC